MHLQDFCPVEIDLPSSDYSKFGAEFSVRVPFISEPRGRIFWINEAWFDSLGVDITNTSVRDQIENWLITTFCIRTDGKFTDRQPFVEADRYGGTDGTAHGGSGRCIFRGRFNVKGAGPTPLIPIGAANHADGKLGLIEAVRGTIYAELAHLETIKGAVRTVAIIALPPFDGPVNRRQCLLIRPNFIRPAHAERSIFFGTSGFAGSDQFTDHIRVQTVRAAFADARVSWETMATNAAMEIGSLDAVRMAQGRFTSSNMSIFGEVADFDSFRIFDTWTHLGNGKRGERRFGRELDDLTYAAKSWAWRLGRVRLDREAVSRITHESHRLGFISTLRGLIPSWQGKRETSQVKLSHYIWGVCNANSEGYHGGEGSWLVHPDSDVREYLERAASLAQRFGFDTMESYVIAGRLQYWRQSRQSIQFTNINAAFEALVCQSSSGIYTVSSWISDQVAVGRCLYRNLGDWLTPLFVVPSCRLLILFDSESQQLLSAPINDAEGGARSNPLEPCSVEAAVDMARSEDARDNIDRRTIILSAVQKLYLPGYR